MLVEVCNKVSDQVCDGSYRSHKHTPNYWLSIRLKNNLQKSLLNCNRYWSMVVRLISHLSSTWLLTATTYWPVNIKINSPFTPLMMQDLQKRCLWMNELLICLIQLAVSVVWLCCVQIPQGMKVGVHYIVSLFFVHKVTTNLYWLIYKILPTWL